MIHNLSDFVRIIRSASIRTPVGLTREEFAAIQKIYISNLPLLKEQIQYAISENFALYQHLSRQALVQEREYMNRETQAGHRLEPGQAETTDRWLKHLRFSTEEWLKQDLTEHNRPALSRKEHYEEQQKELLSWVAEAMLLEHRSAILQDYIVFVFAEHAKTPRELERLVLAMNKLRDSEEDYVINLQRKSMRAVFLQGLLDAAIELGQPVSLSGELLGFSVDGLGDRILDIMAEVRLTLDPHNDTKNSLQKNYIAATLRPFVFQGKPSAAFYALFLEALYPNGYSIQEVEASTVILQEKTSQAYADGFQIYRNRIIDRINSAKKVPAGSPLERYFVPHYDENGAVSGRKLLSQPTLDLEIEKFFAQAYDRYHGVALVHEDTHAESLLDIGSVIKEWRSSSFIKIEGQEECNHDKVLENLCTLTGYTKESMQSLCLLSGGSISNPLKGLFVKKELGIYSEVSWRDILIAQDVSTLTLALPSVDRPYVTYTVHFQEWLEQRLSHAPFKNPVFLMCEDQYLRVLSNMPLSLQKKLLFAAVQEGKYPVVCAILDRYPSWGMSQDYLNEPERLTLLKIAAKSGHAEIVKVILQKGGRALENMERTSSWTALHLAVVYKHPPVVRAILERTISFSKAPDSEGWTALHHAASQGSRELVRVFAQCSDRLLFSVQDLEKCTALHRAVDSGNIETIEILAAIGRSTVLRIQNNKGHTVLHEAAKYNNSPVLAVLAKYSNFEVCRAQDLKGQTALHIAIQKGNVESVQHLLRVGGGRLLHITDFSGSTPGAMVMQLKNKNMIAVCLQYGAQLPLYPNYFAGYISADIQALLKAYCLYNPSDQNYASCRFICKKYGVPWDEGDQRNLRAELEEKVSLALDSDDRDQIEQYSRYVIQSVKNAIEERKQSLAISKPTRTLVLSHGDEPTITTAQALEVEHSTRPRRRMQWWCPRLPF